MPAQPKKPQDRKPKKSAGYSFTGADGENYTLPAPADAADRMTGRDMRDAVMGGEREEASMGFRILERCEPGQDLLDALYDLPMAETLRIVGEWLAAANEQGTTLPQS